MSQESKIIVGYSRDELKKINYNPVTLQKQPDETVLQTQEQNSSLKPAVPITNIPQTPTYSNTFQNSSRTQPPNNTQFQNFQQSKTFGSQQNQYQQQTQQLQNQVQFQNIMGSSSQQKFQLPQSGLQNQQFPQKSGQFQPQPQGYQSGFLYKDNFYPK